MTNTMDQGDRGDIQLPSLFMDDFDWDTLLEDYGMDARYIILSNPGGFEIALQGPTANGSGDNEALVWEPQGSTANDSMLSGADSQDRAKFPSYEYQPWEVVDPPRAPSDQTIIEALDFYVDDVSRPIAQGFSKTRPVEVSSSVTTTEKVDEAQQTVNVDAFALSQKEPSSTDSTPTKPRKRLHCDHVGCKVTFPRNYELERHQKNIHSGTSIYFCPVYGCNRSHKALPRFDKLQSHFRKHLNADRFCCLSQECTAGPFSRTELGDHLSVHGYPQHPEVSKDLLKALKWRLTPTGNHAFQLDTSDMCPLSFQGCTFKGNSFWNHLWNHELSDRSLGYLAISATLTYHDFRYGPWTCPLCKASSSPNESFLCHLESHSKEELFSNKSELVDTLSPLLSGLKPIYDRIERRIIDELRRGLNETERMRVKELTGQEPPV